MALADLEQKYLDVSATGPRIFRGNTIVEPLVDGSRYLNTVYEALAATGQPGNAGDCAYLVSWQLDDGLTVPGASSPLPIGRLLAERAQAGVDVRFILNGTAVVYGVKQLPAFRRNLEATLRLRELTKAGWTSPPLADRVVFDWSGANLTGSHHQKAFVVKNGTMLTAFVGGMEFVPDHWDVPDHTAKLFALPSHALNGTPWGWHDVGVRLQGEAATAVWENFRQRWQEVITLPARSFVLRPGGPTEARGLFNPPPLRAPPAAPVSPTPSVTSAQSVQILRSRFRWKIPNRILDAGVPWVHAPNDRLYEVFRALTKAIAAADTYVYIEDQFLGDQPHIESIPQVYSLFPHVAAAMRAKPALKVILVGSGKSDPLDFSPGLRNTSLSGSLADVIERIEPPQHPTSLASNLAVCRLKNATVHSKLLLIDDRFVAIGSANFQSRSMFGVDSELQAAIVAEDDLVESFRMDLWAEHLRIPPGPRLATVDAALRDITTALGIWRPSWLPASAANMWAVAGNPVGFTTTGTVVEFVGPGPAP
jgi:phosphatidylserine/phosphatidylglycerophosphate/cardiolipin synthase-like enzyme